MPALSLTSSSSTRSYSKSTQILRETTHDSWVKSRREFGASSEETYEQVTSLEAFIDWIAVERLRRMPHHGGRWDRILHNAAYFATQIQDFHNAVEDFVSHSHVAARLIWSTCLVLLKLGPSYGATLDKVFATFSDIGNATAFLSENVELFSTSTEIQQSLAYIYADIVKLVINAATQFGQQQKATAISSSYFSSLFGVAIQSIYTRKDQIANYMWAYSIKQELGFHRYHVHIETLRGFLEPADRIVRLISSNRAAVRASRAELSCNWFQSHLLDFTNSHDHVFVVSGKPGSGKSVLSGWVSERLPRLDGEEAHDVLSFAIANDVRSQLTSTAVAKGLLLQLLERKIGDVALYEALVALHKESAGATSPAKIETALWKAIDVALSGRRKTMIVLDGLDKLSGGEAEAVKVLDQVHLITSKHHHVKAVAFTLPLGKATSNKVRSFVITHTHIQTDIGYMVHDTLHNSPQFHGLKHADIEKIVSRISSSADGSFVWAVLSLELLKREKTVGGIVGAVDNLPKTMAETLKRVTQLINLKDHDTRSLLAWLLVSERPLSLSEMRIFFEIDLGTTSRKPRFTDVERDVLDSVGPIVNIQDGIVRLKHDLVRQHFVTLAASVKDLSNTGDFPFMIKEAHYDLCTRVLAYVKLFVTRQTELTIETISHSTLSELFDSYSVLQYAASYWISHFKQSPMFDASGKHRLVPEFRNCFPNSLLLVQIESTLWETYQSTNYELALYVRQTILGQQNVFTLQNIIVLASLMELISHHEKASTYYYQSYELAMTLYSEDTEILIHLAAAYLKVSKVTFTEKTEVAITRETMIKRVLTYYRRTYGVSHDYTFQYLKMLATLYSETKQYELAVTTWEEVYSVSIERSGRTSTETKHVYERLLEVSKHSSRKESLTEELRRREFEQTQRSLTITDERRWKSVTEMISYYESKKEYHRAEETLVAFWQEISRVSSTSRDVSVQKRKIETTKYYSQFLQRHSRTEEAKTVIEALWSEYSHTEIKSESLAVSITSIATEMKSLSLFKSAKTVLSSVMTYFRQTNKTSSSEFKSIESEYNETVQKMVEQMYSSSSSTSTTTTTSTSSSSSSSSSSTEESLSEVFRSLTSTSATSSTVSKSSLTTIIKSSTQLSSTYIRQGKWTECIQIVSQSLSLTWASIVAMTSSPALPGEHNEEVVLLALRLAEATFALRQIEKAEELYLYIFRACKASLTFTDTLVLKTARELLHFYQTTYQFHKALTIYTEYYKESKTHLGISHKRTVEIAYEIGEFCAREGRIQRAEEFYLDIYHAHVKNNEIQEIAIQAARHLLLIYDNDARWEQAEKIVVALWHTFTTKASASLFYTEFVEKIFSVYIYILKEVKKVSKEEIYKITRQYRETCVKTYGVRNELSIKATLHFAQVCESMESHKEESIKVYEEAINEVKQVTKRSSSSTATSSSSSSTTTTSTTSSTISSLTSIMSSISQAQRSLARLYSSQTSSSSSVEKATTLYTEDFESTVAEYGYTDSRSLERIDEMVVFNAKQNKTEYTQKSLSVLKTAVTESITKIKETSQMITAATSIAKSYIKASQKETAVELLTEMRRQIITGSYTSTNKFGISLKDTDIRVRSFIVAFEQTLYSKTSSSEIMSELMTESLLYQSYHLSIKETTSFSKTLEQGSRLAHFYEKRNRKESATHIWNELFTLFAKYLKASKETNVLREFYDICVVEMTTNGSEVTIISNTANRISNYMQKTQFQEAYDLAWYVDRFIHLHGGWRSQASIETGFLVCLYLTGRAGANKCTDAKLHASMVELSRQMLIEVFRAARETNVSFIQMPVGRMNEITALLSEQKNYTDLEWLLSELWLSRNSQTSWDSVTIVWIGRRLVEVRYAVGRKQEAIHLAKDISYNLRRVWGATDKTTIEMFCLLSELYTASGEFQSAIYVQEDMLRQITNAVDEKELSADEGAAHAQRHLNLLHTAFVRNGGWGIKGAGNYKDLYNHLHHHFGSHKGFHSTQHIEKWSANDKIDQSFGIWSRPSSFDFISVGEKHKNNIRRISGLSSYLSSKGFRIGNAHTHSNGHLNGSTSPTTQKKILNAHIDI